MLVQSEHTVVCVVEAAPVADEPALGAVAFGRHRAVVGLSVGAECEQPHDRDRSSVERVQHVPLTWPDGHDIEHTFERYDAPSQA